MKLSAISRFLFVAILAFAVIKILILTMANPLIAYANNWDFIRTESCIGLYQSYGDRPKTEAHSEGPVNNLIFDKAKIPTFCVKSSDTIFPLIVTFFHDVNDKVDFREIGLARAIFLLVCLAGMAFLLRTAKEKIALGVAFLALFGDIAYLSYFNTLYTEFSVILGTFFAVLTLSFFWSGSKAPRKSAVLFTLVALAWLGLSKEQYMPLAILFGLLAAFIAAFRWKKISLALLFCLISIGMPVAFNEVKGNGGLLDTINYANKTDAFLGAILPSASNKPAALQTLGLPDRCLAGIGQNWYTPELQQSHPCPEVTDVSRLRLLPLLLKDPGSIIKPFGYAIIDSAPLYLSKLGGVETESVKFSAGYRFVKYTSLTTYFDAMPRSVYAALIASAMAIGAMATFWIMSCFFRTNRLRNKTPLPLDSLILMVSLGGIVTFYSLITSVLGDGYIDISKHTVGLGAGLACQVGAGFAWITQLVLNKPFGKNDKKGKLGVNGQLRRFKSDRNSFQEIPHRRSQAEVSNTGRQRGQ